MKRIGLLFLVLFIFSTMLMTGCKVVKQPTSSGLQKAPAASKK